MNIQSNLKLLPSVSEDRQQVSPPDDGAQMFFHHEVPQREGFTLGTCTSNGIYQIAYRFPLSNFADSFGSVEYATNALKTSAFRTFYIAKRIFNTSA